MYRIGMIGNCPEQIKRCSEEMDVIMLNYFKCGKQDLLNQIYEKHIGVLLLSEDVPKVADLIIYINDSIRDLQCFVLTRVGESLSNINLIPKRDIFTLKYVEDLCALSVYLIDSAKVFKARQEYRIGRYKELLDKKTSWRIRGR